jgi:hypothetical protein
MPPKAAKGKAPSPPPSKAKPHPGSKWSDKPKRHKLERASSHEIVQEWRKCSQTGTVVDLDWSSLDSFTYLHGGSGGVLLARFGALQPKLCCVKPQHVDATAELCASFLANALNIPTAKLHVVKKSDDVVQALRQAKPAIEEHSVHLENKILANTHFLGFIEFVNGPVMEGLEFVETLQSRSHADLQVFWEDVGKLVAFDCLINNYDRLPIIWDNDGNLKNVMVQNGTKLKVIGIDQAAHVITSKDGLKTYTQKLRHLVRALSPDDSEDWLQAFRRLDSVVRTEFQSRVCVDASHFKKGLCDTFDLVSRHWQSGELPKQVLACQRYVTDIFGTAEPRSVGLDQLCSVQTLVTATATAIAEELQAHQLMFVPEKVLICFRDAFPNGHLRLEQLCRLFKLLEPSLDSDGNSVNMILKGAGEQEKEYVDWTKVLRWMYA